MNHKSRTRTETIGVCLTPEEFNLLAKSYKAYLASKDDSHFMSRPEFIRRLLLIGAQHALEDETNS